MKRLAIMLLLAAGCGEGLPPGSLVTRTRVVGAVVEAAGDPGRAWPRPGEAAAIEWIVAHPGEPPALGWAFGACRADAHGTGCREAPFAVFIGEGPPALELPVPGAAELGDVSTLLIAGVVCVGGAPIVAEDGSPGCDAASADENDVFVTVPLELAGAGNRRPILDAAALTIAGEPWPAPAAAGCDAAGDAHRVRAGEEVELVVATDGADREEYTVVAGEPPEPRTMRERLQVSAFTTAGELSQQFVFVEGEDPLARLTLTAPAAGELPPAGLPARLTFVLRDGRGGVDVTSRTACFVQ